MMRNAPRIMPLPSDPFLAPAFLDAVVVGDGVPAAVVGPVVVGGTVPVVAPDTIPFVLVAVVEPLDKTLAADLAEADAPPLLVVGSLKVDVSI